MRTPGPVPVHSFKGPGVGLFFLYWISLQAILSTRTPLYFVWNSSFRPKDTEIHTQSLPLQCGNLCNEDTWFQPLNIRVKEVWPYIFLFYWFYRKSPWQRELPTRAHPVSGKDCNLIWTRIIGFLDFAHFSTIKILCKFSASVNITVGNVNRRSHSFSLFIEYECLVFSLGTSPPSAALWWNSGVRQSQKQRKRSKSSTSDESSSNLKGTEGNAGNVTPDERKDKEAAPAWYIPLLSFVYLFTFSFSTSLFTVIHCDSAKIKRMLTKTTNLLFLLKRKREWFLCGVLVKYTFCLKHETQPTVFRLRKHD